jgi:putative hydrolase of the HAD superfamily
MSSKASLGWGGVAMDLHRVDLMRAARQDAGATLTDEDGMIEAVIWDFGGVVTTSPFEAFNRYEAERGLPKDFIRTVNATNPDSNAWARFERSELTLEAFDKAFAEEARALGQDVPGRDVIALLSGDIRPRMVQALEACAARFKTGCITNNVLVDEPAAGPAHNPGMAGTAEKAAAIAAVMTIFDHVIESSKAGIRKPDPRIYEMMCHALGTVPEACVYLDDLGVNLKPARAMGMTTIKVVTEDQALEDLQAAAGFVL